MSDDDELRDRRNAFIAESSAAYDDVDPEEAAALVREVRQKFRDDLEAAAQPHCPECRTVLRTIRRGYWCETCEVSVIGM